MERTVKQKLQGETRLRVRYAETDHIAVVDVRCRYKAPARYDDEIVIRTELKNVRESLLHFGYEIVRADDGALLAEGETTHIVVNRNFERTTLPEKYSRILGITSGAVTARS
jgi:acyl-CoA thioester hydrolase